MRPWCQIRQQKLLSRKMSLCIFGLKAFLEQLRCLTHVISDNCVPPKLSYSYFYKSYLGWDLFQIFLTVSYLQNLNHLTGNYNVIFSQIKYQTFRNRLQPVGPKFEEVQKYDYTLDSSANTQTFTIRHANIGPKVQRNDCNDTKSITLKWPINGTRESINGWKVDNQISIIKMILINRGPQSNNRVLKYLIMTTQGHL